MHFCIRHSIAHSTMAMNIVACCWGVLDSDLYLYTCHKICVLLCSQTLCTSVQCYTKCHIPHTILEDAVTTGKE